MKMNPVGRWRLGVITAAGCILAAATAHAQIPNPTPALNAARDARQDRGGAAEERRGADAGSEARAVAGGWPEAGAPATAADKNAPPPAPGAGYSYDPAGRRDPFVSLTARGGDVPVAAGMRPGGVPGLLVGEVTVKGIFKSPKGGFLALLQAADGRTYSVKEGDKVFDGSVKAITQDTVVFSQDVNDPLSLVKQREVRKSIRPEAR